jgi:cytochrome oxidase assembly protein ShyY1
MTARRWHRPGAFAIVLTLIGVAAFVALGIWQIDRKAQKEQLLAAFANAPSSPTRDLADVRDTTDPSRYPHVRVGGNFLPDRGYLFDEQFHDGRPGVRVLAVLASDADPRLLLVDRGWLAWNHASGTTPAIPSLTSENTQLTGIYAPYPGSGIRVGGNPLPSQTTWPKLTLHVDATEIAADLGKPILPRILLLDPDPNSGFVREWTPNVMPPQRHLAYALTWFTFAVVAVLIFITRHWRKVDNATK